MRPVDDDREDTSLEALGEETEEVLKEVEQIENQM